MQIPEEIVTVAKEAMVRFGSHPPTVFVQGTKRKVYLHVEFGRDNAERISDMANAGIRLATSAEVGDVEMVILVCEGWTSPARAKVVLPSQDPNRMEVLMISAMDVKTNAQTLEMYACLRDYKQAVLDLKPISVPGQVESGLLPAFLSGFRLFKR
jgi:hypothetical protein